MSADAGVSSPGTCCGEESVELEAPDARLVSSCEWCPLVSSCRSGDCAACRLSQNGSSPPSVAQTQMQTAATPFSWTTSIEDRTTRARRSHELGEGEECAVYARGVCAYSSLCVPPLWCVRVACLALWSVVLCGCSCSGLVGLVRRVAVAVSSRRAADRRLLSAGAGRLSVGRSSDSESTRRRVSHEVDPLRSKEGRRNEACAWCAIV